MTIGKKVDHLLPYSEFSRNVWREFRKDMPLPLSAQELEALRGMNEPISMDEVKEVYLPLSRLLNLYIDGIQSLYQVTSKFLGHPEPKVPYIIGVAGSVAVGKSTIARLLKTLLSRWPSHPRVALVTTDGFLYPNEELEKRGLMERKGFPESYDRARLMKFLSDLKSGVKQLDVPIYSHEYYDILQGETKTIELPDIVILEGLNVLQVGSGVDNNHTEVFVSDYFDFSIYVDAKESVIKDWFIERFKTFRKASANNEKLFMHQFSQMSEEKALEIAKKVWDEINSVNLHENIEPYKYRASLILEKGADHVVEKIMLRKI